jgi:hypothetical protein
MATRNLTKKFVDLRSGSKVNKQFKSSDDSADERVDKGLLTVRTRLYIFTRAFRIHELMIVTVCSGREVGTVEAGRPKPNHYHRVGSRTSRALRRTLSR